MAALVIERTSTRLQPELGRAIARPFVPTGGESKDGSTRLGRLVHRILALSEPEVTRELEQTRARFAHRHRDFHALLESNFRTAAHAVPETSQISRERRLLMGAFFTHEYSIEAAALSNPSMVLSPDQSGTAAGHVRFVMSLRSIGEGHISSIEFRTGTVNESGAVALDEAGAFPTSAATRPVRYVKSIFREKLRELGVYGDTAAALLEPLKKEFSMAELNARIEDAHHSEGAGPEMEHATRALHWLAASNYQSTFPVDSLLSERVLFPSAPTESSGMEDARFVRFTDDEGRVTYYATYTAYDGYQILPQLIETTDFCTFHIATLNGRSAKNKGIALFPRKLDGKYAALGRLDNENNFFMTSDHVRFWHDREVIHRPTRPWELTHVGNCGSPLETEAGWLVITHGVGPMRQYALGALLLDLKDPTRVIGSLREPLLEPTEDERDGYVPNVVYSCGSIIVAGRLILPYGFSDVGTGIATVAVADLLSELTHRRSAMH